MSTDTSGGSTPNSSDLNNNDQFTLPSSLQSEEERRLLDTLDSVQHSRLNSVIELPQLIVCGDQSSGKSSVLEAITEIPFPRNSGLCTRFATMIVLRRDTRVTEKINVRIIPSRDATATEQLHLSRFQPSIEGTSALPELIERATKRMGLKEPREPGYQQFSPHTLKIEIIGPNRPMLTLIDLPGYVQTGNDKQFIFDLVTGYMQNSRAIILAVISGNSDQNLQAVFDDVEKLDQGGRRTIGIITKPDRIARQDAQNWIDLALNKHFYLERGWHLLRNRGPEEMDLTFEERNALEEDFFLDAPWNSLPSETVGVKALRQRLSTVLFDHLKTELPVVKEEILARLQATKLEIESLGEERSTLDKKQALLMKMALDINNNVKAAISGYYGDKFFEKMDMEAATTAEPNMRRFRACVQHLNMDYANFMRLKGHRYTFDMGPGDDDSDFAEGLQAEEELDALEDTTPDAGGFSKPKKMTRRESIKWVLEMLRRSRGSELPGHFGPSLIGLIFKEQSKRWEAISHAHLEEIADCCKLFVHAVIQDAAPATTAKDITNKLMELNVDDALDHALENAKKELTHLVADKKVIATYSSSFATDIQKSRQTKHAKITDHAMREARVPAYEYGTNRAQFDSGRLQQALANSIEKSQDKFSAEEALDYTRAYYKEALSHFVQNVVVQVVERHLVAVLPETIMHPVIVQRMTNDEVNYVAAELPETTRKRAVLQDRKQTLEKGLLAFKKAMRGFGAH